MTSKHRDIRMVSQANLALVVTFLSWLLGVAAHLTFQFFAGDWYDGLVYFLGFWTAALIFVTTFALAFLTGFVFEAQSRRRSTLTRCITYIAVGMVVIPIVLVIVMMILIPNLSPIQIGSIAMKELVFSLATRSPILLALALTYEAIRARH